MPTPDAGLAFTIGAAERETGLSKDVLRVWERRYGFPLPTRDAHGERVYSAREVAKLRIIRRLMDAGARPGKVIHLDHAALNALAEARTPARRDPVSPAPEHDVLALLKGHDPGALSVMLATLLVRQGLAHFVRETVAPLDRAVEEALARGEIHVFEQHLYAEEVQVVLRNAIHAFPRHVGAPRVLLTSLPGEQRPLELSMVEALLVSEGAHCICLGTQTPIDDIRRATLAFRTQIVALTFSAGFPPRQAAEALASLRRELPAHVVLWAAGPATRRIRKGTADAVILADLPGILAALRAFRTHADSHPA